MTLNATTIREIAASLRKQYRAEMSLVFRFESCTIRLSTNSSELRDHLAEYFRPFLFEPEAVDIELTALEGNPPALSFPLQIRPPDPRKKKIKEEFADLPDGRVVRKRLTGMLFLLGGGLNVCVGEAAKNYNQVVNFVNNRYIEWQVKRGCLLGHAAAVSNGERGLAVAGFSGMGKSTLALRLMGHDLRFVSNDRLLIRKNDEGTLMMYGVPKQPRINPGTVVNNPSLSRVMPASERSAVRELPRDELWQLEQKYDVMIEEVFGSDRFLLHSPMSALYILNWHHDAGPTHVAEMNLSDRRDLLRAFIKELGLFFDPHIVVEHSDQSDELYLALLAKCRVFEVSGSIDFDYAAKAALEGLHDD